MMSNDLQDLLKFEQKLQNTYEGICQRRKEHETRVTDYLNERFQALSSEIQTENNIMQDSVKQLTQIYQVTFEDEYNFAKEFYQSDIGNLKSGFAQVKADRESGDEKIENYMHTNLTKLSDDVSELQKASETAEKTIFNAIKNSVVEVKASIDAEKKQRYCLLQCNGRLRV